MIRFWRTKKVVRPEALQEVVDLLFPEIAVETSPEGVVFHVDRSVDSNLQAALIDLAEGNNDKVTRDTIEDCLNRLSKARGLLEAHSSIDRKARYVLVDTITGTREVG